MAGTRPGDLGVPARLLGSPAVPVCWARKAGRRLQVEVARVPHAHASAHGVPRFKKTFCFLNSEVGVYSPRIAGTEGAGNFSIDVRPMAYRTRVPAPLLGQWLVFKTLTVLPRPSHKERTVSGGLPRPRRRRRGPGE